MLKNVGTTDRFIRGIGGLVLLFIASSIMGLVGTNLWAVLLIVVGIILLGTAAAGFCPIYKLLHRDTFLPRHK